MHKFVKIKRDFSAFSIEYGYMLLVDTLPELIEYALSRTESIGYDYFDLRKKLEKGQHISAQQLVMRMALEKNDNRKTLLDDIGIINDVFMQPAYKLLDEYGAFVVNNNGGMFGLDSKCEIFDMIESEKFIWPENKSKDHERIKVFQWPNGSHWYAKIDGEDVVVNGIQKWNTSDAAYANVKRYIETFLRKN